MKILLTITLFFAFIQTHAFTIYGFIPWQSQISNSKPHKLNINENLEKFGIKKFRVLYHNSFLTDDLKPDIDKIKHIAQSTATDKTPITFDIEIGNRFRPETNLPVIIKTLQLYRQYGGQAPVSVYAVLPQNVYGGKKLSSYKMQMYRNLNKEYKSVAELVDIISPSLYNYDGKDFLSWQLSAYFSMKEAKKYAKGKPIIPYITGTFAVDGKNPYPIRQALSEQDMKRRLQYLKNLGASGVIVWQSSSEKTIEGKPQTIDLGSRWGKALVNFD